MSGCQHCSQNADEHLKSASANIADYLIMQKLAEMTPEVKETVERILLEWRNHALPECDPLAIS